MQPKGRVPKLLGEGTRELAISRHPAGTPALLFQRPSVLGHARIFRSGQFVAPSAGVQRRRGIGLVSA
jgi:hypothetical protein